MVIEIIYIATNGYCSYAKNFVESLQYFMPGTKKILRILSNGCEEYKLYRDADVLYTEVIPIFDMLYPCINLNKMYYIKQLKPTIADYIFYFDADTLCKNVPEYDWQKMIADLDSGKTLLTLHPVYATPEDTVWYIGEIPARDKSEQVLYMHDVLTDNNPNSRAFINCDYEYIISSFFAARRDVMNQFCDNIIAMIRCDLKRDNGYYIPSYMDENYVNKLALENPESVIKKQYVEYGNFVSKFEENVFIQQKNMGEDNKTNRQ